MLSVFYPRQGLASGHAWIFDTSFPSSPRRAGSYLHSLLSLRDVAMSVSMSNGRQKNQKKRAVRFWTVLRRDETEGSEACHRFRECHGVIDSEKRPSRGFPSSVPRGRNMAGFAFAGSHLTASELFLFGRVRGEEALAKANDVVCCRCESC